jgi:hypothetical protein
MKIGKQMEAIIRYVCAVAMSLAAIVFAVLVVCFFIRGVREHDFSDVLFVLSIFAALTAFALVVTPMPFYDC